MNRTANGDDSAEGLLKGILYGFSAFLVSFINFMVLLSFVLKNKNKRGILDIFVVNLAVSSILTSATVIAVVAYVRGSNSEDFVGKINECYVQYFFGTMLRLTDVATTTVVAVDRFVAVYKPILYRTKVKTKQGYIACVVIWLSSAIITSMPLISGDEMSKDMESLCTADWTTEIAIVVITVAYIQFLIVLICYIGIFKSIRGFVKRQKAMRRSQISGSPTLSRKNEQKDSCSSLPLSDVSSDSSVSGSSSVLYTNQPSDAEIAEKLVQLSKDNIETALREVKGIQNIELETNMKLKKIDTYSSVNLRIKAAINRVSWSDLPEHENDRCKHANISVERRLVRPELHRSNTCPAKVTKDKEEESDEVFIEENKTHKTEREKTFNKRPDRKSISVLIMEKWRGKKLRRSSSIKNFWKESQHFAKIMGVVVLIFYVSWLPLAVSINIVLVTGNQKRHHNILWICYNLSLLSSVAIPIAYAVMCKPYREGYKFVWKYIQLVISFCNPQHVSKVSLQRAAVIKR